VNKKHMRVPHFLVMLPATFPTAERRRTGGAAAATRLGLALAARGRAARGGAARGVGRHLK
jgi:hypothetical protein